MQGHEGDYWWADRLGEALKLLEQFPEIVVGRRVVIAAFDSGPMRASEEELRRGWRQAGDVVVTTVIASFDDIAEAVSDEYSELWIYAADDPIPAAIAALQNRLELAARCQCRARGNAAWVRPSVDEFTAPYDLIERSTSQWNALFRCRTCGAYWVIEQSREYDRDINVATRVHSARDWQLADLVDARRQLLLAGAKESDRPCRWAGCPRRALKDAEVCVDHFYNLQPRERPNPNNTPRE